MPKNSFYNTPEANEIIDAFLKENGDSLKYKEAREKLKDKMDFSKSKYNAWVLHYRRNHKPTKNK